MYRPRSSAIPTVDCCAVETHGAGRGRPYADQRLRQRRFSSRARTDERQTISCVQAKRQSGDDRLCVPGTTTLRSSTVRLRCGRCKMTAGASGAE